MIHRLRSQFGAALLATTVAGCTLVGYPAPVPAPVRAAAGRVVPSREPGAPAPARSYEVLGQTYRTLASSEEYSETGLASWYGEKFQGRRTASGEPFDMNALTAAHRTLPLDTCVEVKRVSDGRTVTVRVNDRGPFDDDQKRIIDLSFAAGQKLGLIGSGTARVEVRALEAGRKC